MKFEIMSIADMQDAIDAIYDYCWKMGASKDEVADFISARLALLYAARKAEAMKKIMESGCVEAFEKAI